MDHPALLDTRLMDLVPNPGEDHSYVRDLARTQAWTYTETGHFLSYSDEYVWRRLKESRGASELPTVRIRCTFCFRSALLSDWAVAAELSRDERVRVAQERLEQNHAFNVGFLMQCDGPRQAKAILNMLYDLTERAI